MRDVEPADRDRYDLPWDPATRDVVCRRDPEGRLHFNLPRQHVHHSLSGWEWGYLGSGPSDLALNILDRFIGPAPDPGPEPNETASPAAWEAWADRNDQRVQLWDGTYVHADAWALHHPFKEQFIATLPPEGGIIPGVVIEAWLVAQRAGQAQEVADDR